MEIDKIDRIIISLLREDASLTNAEVSKQVDLSPSAVHERIKKLQNAGYIKKIAAFIQASILNKSLCVFIYVLIDSPVHNKEFLKAIKAKDEVMECHHIAGEYSYLLKVRVENTHFLEQFITNFLKTIPGVIRTSTQLVLSSPKDGDTVID